MTVSSFVLIVLILSAVAFFLGRRRSVSLANGRLSTLHSRPGYYGWYVALWCGLPAVLLALVWIVARTPIVNGAVHDVIPEDVMAAGTGAVNLFMADAYNLATGNIVSSDPSPAVREAASIITGLTRTVNLAFAGIGLALALAGLTAAYRRITADFRSRNRVERILRILLIVASTLSIFTTIGIVFSVLFESIRFFQRIPILDFLFGLHWSPQIAIRADQVASEGSFGMIPLFAGTLLITFIALAVAIPIGLLAAIYMSEYAGRKTRALAKPLLEILAGIPTVVYGFFAALTVAPLIRGFGESLGIDAASESALAAGLVMGIMIIPFVSSLADDVINAVPQTLRDGSLGLGATTSETIKLVILPAALPGIAAACLLAFSRAIGETMIVVMAAGLAANLTANPFEAVTTVTVQIVTLLVGDQEFDSAKTLAAFALGLVLFVMTLALNVVALHIVRKYRQAYD
ncbi:phosphate ABC transporter permease subunit PstC [Tistrella mobilis]|uniref:phosphate ABC transporter permease subunit PstC n=1 Tax=Tistrella mobilis TaxID=171437 RepID=UPI0031F6FAF0